MLPAQQLITAEMKSSMKKELINDFNINHLSKEAQSGINKIAVASCNCLLELKPQLDKGGNPDDLISTCMQRSFKEVDKIKSSTSIKDDEYIGELVGKQMIVNGCDMLLLYFTNNTETPTSDSASEPTDMASELHALHLSEEDLPILNELAQAYCSCIQQKKETLMKPKGFQALTEGLELCMTGNTATKAPMEKLARKANTSVTEEFEYKVGHIVGGIMAKNCPDFMDILYANPELTK